MLAPNHRKVFLGFQSAPSCSSLPYNLEIFSMAQCWVYFFINLQHVILARDLSLAFFKLSVSRLWGITCYAYPLSLMLSYRWLNSQYWWDANFVMEYNLEKSPLGGACPWWNLLVRACSFWKSAFLRVFPQKFVTLALLFYVVFLFT